MAQIFGWFSEASRCASRSNRARRSGSSGKDRRQDLDRDFASQCHVARAIDLAHASGAERRQNLVMAIDRRLRQRRHRRPFGKVAGLSMRGEQRLDFSLQRSIPATRLVEKRVAVLRRELDRVLKQRFDSIPAGVARHRPPAFGFLVRRRYSQARAVCHSRVTVDRETDRTSATSCSDMPAK